MTEFEGDVIMKIAMIFDGMPVGGIEKVGADYASLLIEHGHELKIVNLRPALMEMEKTFPENCEILHLSYPRWLAPEYYTALARHWKIGSVLYPIARSVMMPVCSLCSLSFRKKLAGYGCFDYVIAFSGHINDLTFVADDVVSAERKLAWLHGAERDYSTPPSGFLKLYAKIKNLVCLSEQGDEFINEFNHSAGIRKKRIYNPIFNKSNEIDRNKVKDLQQRYGSFCLMAARLDDDKDHKTVIRGLLYLKEKYQFTPCMLFAGDGKNRNELERIVRESGMSDQIIFLGNRFDMQNYYAAAKLYIHSSPAEGLPTSILEAMSYGLPIVSTGSLPGCREILGENQYGLVTPVGDEKALMENVYRLFYDKKLCAHYSEMSRIRIQDFSPEQIYHEFEEYLKSLS